MAKQTPIQKRKQLEQKKQGKEFTIEEKIPLNEHVTIWVRVNDEVVQTSTNMRDALLVSRNIKDPENINGFDSEVKLIIERIKDNESKMNASMDALPEWMKSGVQSIVYNALEDAILRVKKHHAAQQGLAFTQALLVGLVKNAIIIVDGEETANRFYVHKSIGGVTYAELNSILECPPIPNDYFDDTEKNAELSKENQPILPKRNVREIAEQQVAWLDVFQEKYPLFSIRLNNIFTSAVNRVAHFVYDEAAETVDDEGFQSTDVDTDLSEAPTTDTEIGQ